MMRLDENTKIVGHEYVILSDMRDCKRAASEIEAMGALVAVDVEHLDGHHEQITVPFYGSQSGVATLARGAGDDDHIDRFIALHLPLSAIYLEIAQEVNAKLVFSLKAAGPRDRMVPDELTFIMARINLSHRSLATMLGVTGRTVERWLSDQQDIPAPVARLLRVITTAEDVRYSWDLVEQLQQLDGTLTTDEFAFFLDVLGWSTRNASTVLGASERSIQNWRNGSRKSPPVVVRIMRLLLDLEPCRADFSDLLTQAALPIPFAPLLIGAT